MKIDEDLDLLLNNLGKKLQSLEEDLEKSQDEVKKKEKEIGRLTKKLKNKNHVADYYCNEYYKIKNLYDEKHAPSKIDIDEYEAIKKRLLIMRNELNKFKAARDKGELYFPQTSDYEEQ